MTRLSDALEVRDSILPFLIGRSHWEETNFGRVLTADAGSFEFLYRTPFQREELRIIRRSYILMGMPSYIPLEYGLAVWHCHHKVLEIEWDSKKNVRVLSYRRRGSWEPELAAAVSGIGSGESSRKPVILLGIGAAAVAAQAWLLADLSGQSRAHDPLYPRIPRGGRTAAEDRRDERLPMVFGFIVPT